MMNHVCVDVGSARTARSRASRSTPGPGRRPARRPGPSASRTSRRTRTPRRRLRRCWSAVAELGNFVTFAERLATFGGFRLYRQIRHQFLQLNIHVAAFVKIYKNVLRMAHTRQDKINVTRHSNHLKCLGTKRSSTCLDHDKPTFLFFKIRTRTPRRSRTSRRRGLAIASSGSIPSRR